MAVKQRLSCIAPWRCLQPAACSLQPAPAQGARAAAATCLVCLLRCSALRAARDSEELVAALAAIVGARVGLGEIARVGWERAPLARGRRPLRVLENVHRKVLVRLRQSHRARQRPPPPPPLVLSGHAASLTPY